jgi:hypothetical protein
MIVAQQPTEMLSTYHWPTSTPHARLWDNKLGQQRVVTMLTWCGLPLPAYFLADEKHSHCLESHELFNGSEPFPFEEAHPAIAAQSGDSAAVGAEGSTLRVLQSDLGDLSGSR